MELDQNTQSGGENSQTPGQKQEVPTVPHHVVGELRAELRVLKEQAESYKKLLEMQSRPAPTVSKPDTSEYDNMLKDYDAEELKVVQAVVDKRVTSVEDKFGRIITKLADENDDLKFRSASGKDYDKYNKKVEAKFIEEQRMGRFTPRELIYQNIRNEERAKKADQFEALEKQIKELQEATRQGYVPKTNDIQNIRVQQDPVQVPVQNAPNINDVHNSLHFGGVPTDNQNRSAQKKAFKDMTPEEMADDLERRRLARGGA